MIAPKGIAHPTGFTPAALFVNGHGVTPILLQSEMVQAIEASPKVETAYTKMEATVRKEKMGIWSIPGYATGKNFVIKHKHSLTP